MALPSTLTPDLLENILAYARNQRRKIENEMRKVFGESWEPCGPAVSDKDFYLQLHSFLQDANNRLEFNSIANRFSNRRRNLALHESILRHYSRLFPAVSTERNFGDSIHENIDIVVEIIEGYSKVSDAAGLMNVTWSFLDLGLVSLNGDLKEVFAEYPDLWKELSDYWTDTIEQDSTTEIGEIFTSISQCINDLKTSGYVISKVEKLLKLVEFFRIFVSTEFIGLQDTADEIYSKHAQSIESSQDLEAVTGDIWEWDENRAFPQNWRTEFKEIDRLISDYIHELESKNNYIEQLRGATSEQTIELAKKITQSGNHQLQILESIQTISNRIATPDNADVAFPESNGDLTSQREPISRIGVPPLEVFQDLIDEEESASEAFDEDPENAEDPLTSSQESEIIKEPAVEEDPKQTALAESSPQESARTLIDTLIAEGEFALAYWVAKCLYAEAPDNCIDPNIIGAIAEGTLVEPGSTYSASLTAFIEELTTPKNWSSDENILLVLAIVQPLLFLRSYPESLYQVASSIPDTISTAIVENIRNNYSPQGIALDFSAVRQISDESGSDDNLSKLKKRAAEHIRNIENTRFRFPVAERALKHFFRKDSHWTEILKAVTDNDFKNSESIKDLCNKLNPEAELNVVHGSLSGYVKKIEGPQKGKLLRLLHKTIDIGREWIDIVEEKSQKKPKRIVDKMQALKYETIKGIDQVLKSLDQIRHKSAVQIAVYFRLSDIKSILEGSSIRSSQSIEQVCLNLPGVRLDDEMTPIGNSLENFVNAVAEFNMNGSNPKSVFQECLQNDEYVRASSLIELHSLGNEFIHDLAEHCKERRTILRSQFAGLQDKVEEAFLLGQTWNSDYSEGNFRTDLLSLIEEGIQTLNSQDDDQNHHQIRIAAEIADEINIRLDRIEGALTTKLKQEKENIYDQFPKTDQGANDASYFQTTFSQCLEQEDYVTAFDLLDRARLAIDQNEPIAKSTSTRLSEHFGNFLEFARTHGSEIEQIYRKESINRDQLNAIRRGKVIFDIHFSEIDKQRREESQSVLKVWASPKFQNHIKDVCRFIGFPVGSNAVREGSQNRKSDLLHFEVSLDPVGIEAPLPGFGSRLNSQLDVVVVQVKKEPEQVAQYVKQLQLPQDKGVLVILQRNISPAYRLKWMKQCVQSKLMMLPLDGALLMYLCGQRNRFSVLLQIGLPMLWAQPYIRRGGTGVASEMFVGREREVSDLIDPDGGCIVYGGRQLGKSALLTHIQKEHHRPDRSGGQFVFYLDVNNLGEPQKPDEMMAEFWQRVERLLANIQVFSDLQDEKKRGRVSKTEKSVPLLIEKALSSDEQLRVMLLLDETDKLLDLDSQTDFTLVRGLRELMEKFDRRFKVILAGLQSVQRYNAWRNHPFAQLGKEIVVNPLQPRSAEKLIKQPFRALGYEFETPQLVGRIVSISNYHPGLIQIFCYLLLQKLYEKYSDWDSLVRTVTKEDVLAVERDASFKRDVRDRFNWTLDLDDRYKVLTYGLVLSEVPTSLKSMGEFKSIGNGWWPQVFGSMDTQAMRALLDELVGLGVLIAESDEQMGILQYRIRSPNLLRLLGTKPEIEDELLRIIQSDSLNQSNPLNYRKLLDHSKKFGPLTSEQEGYIANDRQYFSTVLILGSSAMGLGEVSTNVRQVFRYFRNSDGSPWVELKVPQSVDVTDADNISEFLKDRLSRKNRKHCYTIIDSEQTALNGNVGEFLEKITDELKNKCKEDSQGRLIVVLNPQRTWDWFLNQRRPALEERNDFTVTSLKRWTSGAISNALETIDFRTSSKLIGSEIHSISSGVHDLVLDIIAAASDRKKHSESQLTDVAVQAIDKTVSVTGAGMLSDLGISDDHTEMSNFIQDLYITSESKDGNFLIKKHDLDQALERFVKQNRYQNTKQEKDSIRSWFETLGFIRMLEKDKEMFSLCKFTIRLLDENTSKNLSK